MNNLLVQTLSLEELNTLDAHELLAYIQEVHGSRAGIITSFQNTGCVIIDIARQVAPDIRIMTIDTLRLHPETYDHIAAIEQHYDIRVERFTPNLETLINMVRNHGEYLFFDSKPKQEYCCNVRKVEPNRRALSLLDVWITGLRRDQPVGRIEPDDGVLGIGSGSVAAMAAAKALLAHTQLDAREIATEALMVAAAMDIYTNTTLTIEEI